MSTYATRIAPDHVQALNMIEIAFSPKRFSTVVEAWRTYLIHLNTDVKQMNEDRCAAHNVESYRLFRELMYTMSASLGYGLTRDMLARGVYHPVGNQTRDEAIVKILDGASKVFAGETSLGMDVRSFPTSPEAADLLIKAYTAFLKLLEEKRVFS